MAKRFFYVAAGVLMLALAYHFGAESAGAQAGSQVAGFTGTGAPGNGGSLFVMTSTGDIYYRGLGGWAPEPSLVGNFWGGPTPTQSTTFGAIKAKFRR